MLVITLDDTSLIRVIDDTVDNSWYSSVNAALLTPAEVCLSGDETDGVAMCAVVSLLLDYLHNFTTLEKFDEPVTKVEKHQFINSIYRMIASWRADGMDKQLFIRRAIYDATGRIHHVGIRIRAVSVFNDMGV